MMRRLVESVSASRTPRRLGVVAIAVALVAAACSASSATIPTSGSPVEQQSTLPADTTPPRSVPKMDLSEAGGALEEPDTAIDAVITILDVLNIGVYQNDGTPIVTGTERGPDDLWLSMAEVSGLAEAARRHTVPFGRMTELLNKLAGTDLSNDEVVSTYREMVATLPDHPMSRVLNSLAVDLRADGEITPFDGWLLLIAMAPPSTYGQGEAMAGYRESDAPTAIRAGSDGCPPVGAGNADPDYGLAQSYVDKTAGSLEGAVVDELAEGTTSTGMATASNVAGWWKKLSGALSHATELLDVSKIWAVYENIEPTLDVSKPSVHKVHDTQGKTVEKERTEIVASVRWKGMGDGSGSCFASRALGLPPPGPLENAGVKITIDDTLAMHGWIRRHGDQNTARQLTDATGTVQDWYEPKNERPKSAQRLGAAFERRASGKISAEFDFAGAFEQFLNPYGAIEAVFDVFDVNVIEYPLQVVWHDPAARATVVIDLSPPWSGAAAIDLKTCDGKRWTGSLTLDGSLSIAGGTMTQKGDIDLALDVEGNTATTEFVFPVSATMTASGFTVDNQISSQQRLTLTLPEDSGPVSIDLETIGGSQTITGPGGTVTGSVDSWMGRFSAPLTANEGCTP